MSPLGVVLLPVFLVVRLSSGFHQQQQRAVRCLRQNVVSALEQQQQSVDLGGGGGDREDGWQESWKSDEYRWYILQCYTGQESWCASTIQEALLERPKMAERVAEIVVPFENVASTRGRKVFHKPRIVYPGYVFCRLRLEHDLWALLVRMPKVVNFIGNDPGVRNGVGDVRAGIRGVVQPVPLEEDEAERMLSIVRRQQDASDAIVGTFDLGDKVAVVQGNNAGERGLVRTVRNDLLVVRLLGVGAAAFDIELDPRHVRKLTDAEIDEQAKAEAAAKKRAEAAAASDPAAGRSRPAEDDYGSTAAIADAQIRSRRERKDNRRQSRDIGDEPLQRSASRPSRWESRAAAAEQPASSSKNEDVSFLDDLFKDFEQIDSSASPRPKEDDDAFLRSLLSDDEGDRKPRNDKAGGIFDLLEEEDMLSGLDDDTLLRDILGDPPALDEDKIDNNNEPSKDDDALLKEILGGDQPQSTTQEDAAFLNDLPAGDIAALGNEPKNEDEDALLRDIFGEPGRNGDAFAQRIDAEDDELLSELLNLSPDSPSSAATPQDASEEDALLAQLLGEGRRASRDGPTVGDDEVDAILGNSKGGGGKGQSFLDDELFDDEMLDKLLGDDQDDDLRAADFDTDDKLLQMLGLFDDDDDRKRREKGSSDDDVGVFDDETVAAVPTETAAAIPPPPPQVESRRQSSSDYSVLTVPELKAELKSRGLKVSGRKAELIARLEEEEESKQ